MFKLNRFQLSFFVCSALLAGYLGFCAFDTEAAIQLVKHGGYWLMLLTFALLIFNLYQRVQQGWRDIWEQRVRWRLPCIFILVSTVILLTMQPSGYKIVMDEPVLAATSLQMHLNKEVMTVSRAYEVNGVYHLLGGYVDKRPYFFPFLTSLLHDFTGYRALQGVVLNALLTPLFLGLLFITGRLLWSRWGGYLAVCLFSTVPLLAMNANGAGFELLNLAMILGAMLAAYSYLRNPDLLRMNTLILMGLLLAQTRYESILYVFSVGFICLYSWFRQKEIVLSKVMILAPLLLVSFPLLQIIFKANPELWQLENHGVDRPFSVDFIMSNLYSAGDYFLAMDTLQPNSFLLSILFILSLCYAVCVLLNRRSFLSLKDDRVIVLLSFGVIVLLNFFILMAYHWGQINDIVACRLVLPFLLFQVLSVVAAMANFRSFRYSGLVCVSMILLFFVCVTRPLCARSDFLMWGISHYEANWLQRKVHERQGEPVLFLTNQHLVPIAEQMSGLIINRAIQRKDLIDLHLRLGTFSEIIVVYLSPTVGETAGAYGLLDDLQLEQALHEAFEIEILEVERLSGPVNVCMARLKSVRIADSERIIIDIADRSAFQDGTAYRDFSKTLP